MTKIIPTPDLPHQEPPTPDFPTPNNAPLFDYIHSQDLSTYTTNTISAILFTIIILLGARALAIARAGGGDNLLTLCHRPATFRLLGMCLAFCVVTYLSNLLIQGVIADFIRALYRSESAFICASSFGSCVRSGNLSVGGLGYVSLTSCLLALSSMIAWLVVVLRGRGGGAGSGAMRESTRGGRP